MKKGSADEPRAFDIFGNVALVKFSKEFKNEAKRIFAEKLLKKHKSIKTVLEKTGEFKGRLRKQRTKYLAGEKTKEVLHKENGCFLRFNVDETYFSPRLSNERKEISDKVKNGDLVLVMFAGVGPFSIAIARNSRAKLVYSNEINRKANKYGRLNAELNKVKNKIIFLDGDIKRIARRLGKYPGSNSQTPQTIPAHPKIYFPKPKTPTLSNSQHQPPTTTPHRPPYTDFLTLTARRQHTLPTTISTKIPTKFDVIVMPRPNLKESFLKEAFMFSKKGTRIFYYDFCKEEEINSVLDKIKTEANKSKKKINIFNVKKAGEVAPYKYRIRVDFRVL